MYERDYCMERSRSKAEFKKEMKKLGHDMVYTPERKYITYILRLENGEERQAQNAAVAAGLAIGAATALIQHALQKDEPTEIDPHDDEGWGYDISM